MTKLYSGPYGNYEAGTLGAVMNALCEKERLPTTAVDYFNIGMAGLRPGQIAQKSTGEIVANYIWVGDYIFFEWLNTYKQSAWAVDFHGVHYLHPKLVLKDGQLEFEVNASMLPYEEQADKEACFKEMAHWFNVRLYSDPALHLQLDYEKLLMRITLLKGKDIKTAVKEFKNFDGFRFQSSADTVKWLNSFDEKTVKRAEKMFHVFSRTINTMPNQNYCMDFKNLETRMRLAWLELAWHQLHEFDE